MRTRVALASVFFCGLASAGTFHVSPTGDDAAAGSAAAPWKTIQRAATAVTAGDTVMIAAGTYAGFSVTAQGTQAAPITFTGQGAVRIVGNAAGVNDAVSLRGAAYVVLEGLNVTGATRAGVAALDCHHITVRKSVVDANGRWGVFSSFCDDLTVEDNQLSRSGTEHGVYASNSADRPVIRRNKIFGNGMCGVHMNGDINFGGDGVISGAIVEDNVITNNGARGGSGINGDGVTGAIIRNNVLDGNHASGISLYMIDGGKPSTGNQVINNTVRMASDARGGLNIQDGSTGNIVRNNIFSNPAAGRGAVEVCSSCFPGMTSDRNAIVGTLEIDGSAVTLATWRSRTGADNTSFTSTDAALFTNPGSGDLTLRAGSPAIDVGSPTGAPAKAIDGTLRPQGDGIDLGAYEHCAGPCTGGPSDGGDPDQGQDGSGEEPGEEPTDEGDVRMGEPATGTDEMTGGCNAVGSSPAGAVFIAGILSALLLRRRGRARVRV